MIAGIRLEMGVVSELALAQLDPEEVDGVPIAVANRR
jgi:hypothetical protein